MTVAVMREEHVEQVKELLDLCFSDAWSQDAVRSELQKDGAVSVIALEDGEVVAYLAFEKILDEGTVAEVAVHPAFRRRGIARRLLEMTMNMFDDLKTVTLEVREGNVPARSLYRAMGFDDTAVRKNYYRHPVEDAVIMTKLVRR